MWGGEGGHRGIIGGGGGCAAEGWCRGRMGGMWGGGGCRRDIWGMWGRCVGVPGKMGVESGAEGMCRERCG